MDHFDIVFLPIADIKIDPENVYEHQDADIARLVGSISEHGFLSPLVIERDTMTLVGGEARLEAAKSCHYETVPCVLAFFGDAEQRKAAAIALNSRFGKFNDDKLRKTLLDLKSKRYDLDFTALQPWVIESTLDLSKKKRDFSRPGQQNQAVPPLSYQLVFDDDTQLDLFHDFVRYLASTYPHHDSLGARLSVFVAELQLEASNEDIA